MISFKEFLKESKKKKSLHLFEDGEMSFGEIRNIVEDIFSKNIVSICPRKPIATVSFTCIDGKVYGTLNGFNPSTPVVSEKIVKEYNGSKSFKEALSNSLSGIEKYIYDLDLETQDKLFNKGHRFLNIQVYAPTSEQSLEKANNRFLAIPTGTTSYDEKFENELPLRESDEEITQRIFSVFSVTNKDKTKKASNLDPFAKEAYKLTEDAIKCFAQCPNRKEAIQEVSQILNELIDGLGYCATFNDYIKERYERKIINAATSAGLELRRSSDFVSELVDRLSTISSKRPTMGDLTTYAKRDGVDIKSEQYKKFIDMIEGALETDNQEMLKPISRLLNKIVVLFLKSILGYVHMCDPKLQNMVTLAIDLLENDEEMTEANLTILKKLFVKLYEFAKTHFEGDDFAVLKGDKPYTIKCRFPAIDSLGTKILKV